MMFSSPPSLDRNPTLAPSSAWRIQAGRSALSLRVEATPGVPGPLTDFKVRSGLLRIEGDRLYLRFALDARADAHRPHDPVRTRPLSVATERSAESTAARSADLLDGAVITVEALRTSEYDSVEEFSGLLRCDEGRAHIHAVTTRSSTPFTTEGANCFALAFQAESRFTFRWPDPSGQLASGHSTDVVGRLRLEAVPVWAPTLHAARSRRAQAGQAVERTAMRTA